MFSSFGRVKIIYTLRLEIEAGTAGQNTEMRAGERGGVERE